MKSAMSVCLPVAALPSPGDASAAQTAPLLPGSGACPAGSMIACYQGPVNSSLSPGPMDLRLMHKRGAERGVANAGVRGLWVPIGSCCRGQRELWR